MDGVEEENQNSNSNDVALRSLTGEEEEVKDEEAMDEEEENDEQKREPRRMTTRSRTRRGSISTGEDSDSDEDKPEEEHRTLVPNEDSQIHVGKGYQAHFDDNLLDEASRMNEPDRDTVVWKAPEGLDRQQLIELCELARDRYRMPMDRVLFLLQSSDFDFKRTLEILPYRRVVTDEWGQDDTLLFQQAFQAFGKNFNRIRQVMPHRSMSAIIDHYYLTKKRHGYYRQHDPSRLSEVEEYVKDCSSDSEDEGKIPPGVCQNCHQRVDRLAILNDTKLCNTCALYLKLMLKPRPVPANIQPKKRRRKCPDEYYDTIREYSQTVKDVDEKEKKGEDSLEEDSSSFARVFMQSKAKCLRAISDMEIETKKCRARARRMESECKKDDLESKDKIIERCRAMCAKPSSVEDRTKKINPVWSDTENMFAFHCFMRYGTDWNAISEVIGTKTIDMIKTFYEEHKEEVDLILEERKMDEDRIPSIDDAIEHLPEVECIQLE